jgi:thimet oligopeptidase
VRYTKLLHSGWLLGGLFVLTASVRAADLLPLDWTISDPAAVGMLCTQRLAAIAQSREAAETVSLESEPLVILRAYDALYAIAKNSASEIWVLSQLAQQDSVRKAAGNCYEQLEATRFGIQHSRPLFERLLSAQKAGAPQELRYILNRQLDSFRRNGADRDETTRAQLAALLQRIAAANFEFEDNVNNDVRTIEVAATELTGLSTEVRNGFPAAANGRVRIAVDEIALWPILNHSDNASLRKQALQAYDSRGWPANDAVFKRLAADRAELAKLLGFDTYAHYHLADHMVRAPQNLQAFIDQMAATLRAPSDHVIAQLLARARQDTPGAARLPEWSSARARTQLEQEVTDIDMAEVRRYFSYQNSRDGLIELTQDLFGVRIRPWSTKVWAPNVDAFEMLEGERVIGRFYIDPFPRGGKHKGWRVARIRTGTKAGPIPELALIINTEQGRINHRDVVDFFHEFGHLLHVIFSGQVELAMQNSRDMEFDFLEAPSQALEAWAWDYETLRRFARDEAGQSIPRSVVERLNASRALHEAYTDMHDLGSAAISLDYYSRDLTGVDLTAAYFNTLSRYLNLDWTPNTHPQAAFTHLTDYGPAYYTYLWSKALAVDLLTRFRKEGLRNPATAKAYRDTILAPGGSESMNVLARRFLGRNWSAEAYVAQVKAGAPSVPPSSRAEH